LSPNYILEVCANSVQSAINAQIAGAQRIELCENLGIGGTTPSYGSINLARKKLSIKIHVLIRPRAGDFLYSKLEFEQIKEDIKIAKDLGVDGIVCGILLPNGNVDTQRTIELVELSKPLCFTFHRAFDFAPDPFEALEDVISTGASRLLTSGQKPKAIDAIHTISQLVIQAGSRITVMPGSGVNAQTIGKLIETGAREFHMSGAKTIESGMYYKKPYLSLGSDPTGDYRIMESSIELIQNVIKTFRNEHT
jgi:copper homeostasis protein